MKATKTEILKKGIIWAALFLVCGGGLYLIFNMNHAEYVEDVSSGKLRRFRRGEYSASPAGEAERYAPTENQPAYEGAAVVLGYGESAAYRINVDRAGVYYLAADYYSAGNSYLDYTVEVNINGEAQYQEWKTVELSLYWQDSTDEYGKDRYGDELGPACPPGGGGECDYPDQSFQ